MVLLARSGYFLANLIFYIISTLGTIGVILFDLFANEDVISSSSNRIEIYESVGLMVTLSLFLAVEVSII